MAVPGTVDRPPGYRAPAAFFYPPFGGQANTGTLNPKNLQFITVTGTFLNHQGVPMAGTVTFTPTVAPLKDVPSALFTGAPVTVTLNAFGSLSVSLVCTGNNDLLPFAWTYTITTVLNGITGTFINKSLPYSPSSTIDLSDVLP